MGAGAWGDDVSQRGPSISVSQDEKRLEMDGGVGHTTVGIY